VRRAVGILGILISGGLATASITVLFLSMRLDDLEYARPRDRVLRGENG